MGTSYHPKDILKQVQLMRSQIIKIAATRDIRLKTPRQCIATTIIQIARRYRETYLNIHDISNCSIVYDLLNFLKIRQISSIISHETRNARFFTNTINSNTIGITGSQRFLYVTRLTCTHCHNSKRSMTRRWSGNINCINIRILN